MDLRRRLLFVVVVDFCNHSPWSPDIYRLGRHPTSSNSHLRQRRSCAFDVVVVQCLQFTSSSTAVDFPSGIVKSTCLCKESRPDSRRLLVDALTSSTERRVAFQSWTVVNVAQSRTSAVVVVVVAVTYDLVAVRRGGLPASETSSRLDASDVVHQPFPSRRHQGRPRHGYLRRRLRC